MDHPVVKQLNVIGYPWDFERSQVGTDSLGNEVYEGEEILVLGNEYFLVEELSVDAIQILEMLGAEYDEAK